MTIKEISGDDLPPGLREALIGHLTGDKEPRFKAANLANIQGLLEGRVQPKFEVGDIVTLRPWAFNLHKWPKEGDKCIVTQVLDEPIRFGEAATMKIAEPLSIAIAFVDSDGDVCEYLYDARRFIKVGSIYDPVTLPDGETVSVQ